MSSHTTKEKIIGSAVTAGLTACSLGTGYLAYRLWDYSESADWLDKALCTGSTMVSVATGLAAIIACAVTWCDLPAASAPSEEDNRAWYDQGP